MYLRKLQMKDASFMIEWMHDENVTRYMATDFANKTIDDVSDFIRCSKDETEFLHRAVVADSNEYMGTVSLKHINYENSSAEFAIVIRSLAMSKGYSWFGMTEMLRIAFEDLGLESVYWCVSRKNSRAIRFYDKHGFHEAVDIPQSILDCYKQNENLKWYSVLKGDDYLGESLNRDNVLKCKIIGINTIPTVDAGELSFVEGYSDVPFDIKRIYYISKVPEGMRRGFHAHKELKQLLFCPYGKIQIVLDDGAKREEIVLSDPSVGIIIDRPIWREMLWLEKNSVLCAVVSEHYNPDDYIRDYDEFLKYVGEIK